MEIVTSDLLGKFYTLLFTVCFTVNAAAFQLYHADLLFNIARSEFKYLGVKATQTFSDLFLLILHLLCPN